MTSSKPYIKIDKAFLHQAGAPVATCTTICGNYPEPPRSPGKIADVRAEHDDDGQPGLRHAAYAGSGQGARLAAAWYREQSAWFGRHRSCTVDIARTGKPYLVAMTTKNCQVLRFSGGNTAPVPGPPAGRPVPDAGPSSDLEDDPAFVEHEGVGPPARGLLIGRCRAAASHPAKEGTALSDTCQTRPAVVPGLTASRARTLCRSR